MLIAMDSFVDGERTACGSRRAGCEARRSHVRVGGEHAVSPMPRRRFFRTSRHRAEETPEMSVPVTDSVRATSDPTGLHRVLDATVVLPQAAQRLDTRREIW